MSYTFLTATKEYMESKGIVFSSDHTDLELGEAYAIMGGKTSLRLLRYAEDGINGLVLFCARDGIDCDNLVSALGKEVYDNSGDSTRPYKIQILPEEMDIVIDLLKQNSKNIAF